MRSLGAAAKKAERATNRHNRAVIREAERDLRQLSQSTERTVKQAYDFEQQLVADPIRALDLRFQEGYGLVAAPYQIQTTTIQGSIFLLEQRSAHPQLTLFQNDNSRISLLDFCVTPFGTLLVLRIDNFHAEHRIRLNFLKKSDPRSSPVFLVDDVNNLYYYPKATDLSGEVVPHRPRIGILAFDTFRVPTPSVQIHFSGVKLGPGKGTTTFKFDYRPRELPYNVQKALSTPRLGDRVAAEIQRLTSQYAGMIHQRASSQLIRRSGGCLGCGTLLLAAPVGALVAAWSIFG